MENSVLQVPLILCDIDGVICINDKVLQKQIMKYVSVLKKRKLSELEQQKPQLDFPFPMTFVSNRSGIKQYMSNQLCQSLNKYFDKQQDQINNISDTEFLISIEHAVDEMQKLQSENQISLLIARKVKNNSLEDISKSYGIKKYVTSDQYIECFPEIIPYYQSENKEKMRHVLGERLGITNFDFPFQIGGIFILFTPTEWENHIQLICDLLSTENGIISKVRVPEGPEQHIPVFTLVDMIKTISQTPLPRLMNGMFNLSLQSVYKAVYKKDIKFQPIGKPGEEIFKLAIENYKKKLGDQFKISKIYMIGDSPEIDIAGANKLGITSILVKTGNYYHGEHVLTQEYTPDLIFDDFCQTLKFILKDCNFHFNIDDFISN